MKTKISLSSQTKVVDDVDFGTKNIKNLADPVDPQDAVTLSALSTAVALAVSNGAGVIGVAEDNGGSYTDGLFVDLTATTPVGTAIDRFNEVLKSLSPQPAPNLSSMSANSGVSGKISFGPSSVIANYNNVSGQDVASSYTVSGNRLGIFNGSTNISGTIANNVAPNYANSRPYPNNSFGDANSGLLHLELNGSVIHTIDLSSFVSGSSLNANGSGFNLGAATPVAFTNGDPFTVFLYRTGTWILNSASLSKGYNTVKVKHEYSTGLFRTTQTYDFVVDADTSTVSFSSEALTGLTMTGSKYLSGVQYNTGGSASYGVTASNVFKNTFSSSASAISHTGTNCSSPSEALPSPANATDALVLTGKTTTITASRLLNSSITLNTVVSKTVQSSGTSAGVSIAGILLDSVSDNDTTAVLNFNGEARRIHQGLSLTNTSYGSGVSGTQPSAWDSTKSLVGADSNHNTGLQVYNGTLIYPKTNFSTITNGPASNVNYSGASGLRTYIAYFYDVGAHSNFKFNIVGTNIAFVPVATGPSGNNLTLEILAPNTTKNGSTVEWKDATVAYTNDNGIGCYAGTYGSTVPTNWGCTIGSKNTSTSGNVIVVRITASAAWVGSIDSMTITWL